MRDRTVPRKVFAISQQINISLATEKTGNNVPQGRFGVKLLKQKSKMKPYNIKATTQLVPLVTLR